MSGETMERIVPDLINPLDKAGQLSLQLHLERYNFACRYLLPGRVLDIACGTGYGTSLLAECSNEVCTGVDISPEAIAYAQKRYAHERTRFICESITGFTDEEKFMNIVSLETIEHIEDPKRAIAHLHSLLLSGGHLIVSAPVTPSVDANPYHVNDFTSNSFRKRFSQYGFVEVDCQEQKQPYSLKEISGKQGMASKTRKGLLNYYLLHPVKLFLRLRSLLIDGFNNKYLVLVLKKPD